MGEQVKKTKKTVKNGKFRKLLEKGKRSGQPRWTGPLFDGRGTNGRMGSAKTELKVGEKATVLGKRKGNQTVRITGAHGGVRSTNAGQEGFSYRCQMG